MSCTDIASGDCDMLWAGESMVSSNCDYLLTMEDSGNLVLYDVSGTRRRLLQSTGWASDTAVTDGTIPVLTFFSDGTQSGVAIYELSSETASIQSASSIWSIEADSSGDGMELALGDDAEIAMSDAEGELWSELASFTVAVDTDTDSDTDTGSNGGDAANSGAAGTVSSDGVTSQWWFWVMLFGTVIVLAALLVMHKLNRKFDAEQKLDDLQMVEAQSPTSPGYAGSPMSYGGSPDAHHQVGSASSAGFNSTTYPDSSQSPYAVAAVAAVVSADAAPAAFQPPPPPAAEEEPVIKYKMETAGRADEGFDQPVVVPPPVAVAPMAKVSPVGNQSDDEVQSDVSIDLDDDYNAMYNLNAASNTSISFKE